jgi:hypothetical protein
VVDPEQDHRKNILRPVPQHVQGLMVVYGEVGRDESEQRQRTKTSLRRERLPSEVGGQLIADLFGGPGDKGDSPTIESHLNPFFLTWSRFLFLAFLDLYPTIFPIWQEDEDVQRSSVSVGVLPLVLLSERFSLRVIY